jgi:hypothetical protein
VHVVGACDAQASGIQAMCWAIKMHVGQVKVGAWILGQGSWSAILVTKHLRQKHLDFKLTDCCSCCHTGMLGTVHVA